MCGFDLVRSSENMQRRQYQQSDNMQNKYVDSSCIWQPSTVSANDNHGICV